MGSFWPRPFNRYHPCGDKRARRYCADIKSLYRVLYRDRRNNNFLYYYIARLFRICIYIYTSNLQRLAIHHLSPNRLASNLPIKTRKLMRPIT